MDRVVAEAKQAYISLSPQTTLRMLPQSYPFVMLDRVKACYPDIALGRAVKHITMTDPVLSGHFPGFPIYPGVLVVEAMVQTAGMTVTLRSLCRTFGSLEKLVEQFQKPHGTIPGERKQYVLAESRVKYLQPIFPGCALELEARLEMEREGMYVFKASAQVEGVEVATGQLKLAEVPPNLKIGVEDRIGHG